MTTQERPRHVGIATVTLPEQVDLLAAGTKPALLRALAPDKRAKRYGRTWRLSRPQTDGDAICGRLGYSTSRPGEETVYDDEREDFVVRSEDRTEGAASCYTIYVPDDLASTVVIAFEERPPQIRRQSFIGAMAHLLHESDRHFKVEPIRRRLSLDAWIGEMDTVVAFTGSFRRPNPRWQDRTEQVRAIVEETGADEVSLKAKADPAGPGLNIPGSILGGIAKHSDAGYGDFAATGTRNGSEFTFADGASEVMAQMPEGTSNDPEDIYRKLLGLARRAIHNIL